MRTADRFSDDELRALLRTVLGRTRRVPPDDPALNYDIETMIARRHKEDETSDDADHL